MKFSVMSRRKAKEFQSEPHNMKSAIITICDTDKENIKFNKTPENGIRAVLPLQFDDVDFSTASPHEKVISKQDAEKIVKFINTNKNKVQHIIVNCEAGVSRSAGVCAAIMKALTGDDDGIFSNGKFCPNMTCYRRVLEAFFQAGYFEPDDKGLSEEEISIKEEENIKQWKKLNDF